MLEYQQPWFLTWESLESSRPSCVLWYLTVFTVFCFKQNSEPKKPDGNSHFTGFYRVLLQAKFGAEKARWELSFHGVLPCFASGKIRSRKSPMGTLFSRSFTVFSLHAKSEAEKSLWELSIHGLLPCFTTNIGTLHTRCTRVYTVEKHQRLCRGYVCVLCEFGKKVFPE